MEITPLPEPQPTDSEPALVELAPVIVSTPESEPVAEAAAPEPEPSAELEAESEGRRRRRRRSAG